MRTILNTAWFNGLIQILISLCWIWYFGRFMYLYHYTDLLFNFRYPDWILLLFLALGLLGVYVGITVLLKKRKVRTGYLLLVALLVVGLLFDLLVTS